MSLLSQYFFKHFPYTVISRNHLVRHHRVLHQLPPSSACISPLSSVLLGARRQWRPNLSCASNSSSSSSSLPSFSSSSSSSRVCLDVSSPDSSSSSYLSVRIVCPKDVADMLSDALLCFGASSTITDEQDWSESTDKVCIGSIFPKDQNVDACILHAADSIGLKDMPSYEVIIGEQYDWIKKTQESFHPVKVTEGIWIVPEWKSPPDVEATNIILNPGLAFGTGEHPTTKLCLLLLHGLIKGGELFLDYGTGSGILAIAALKFGAALSVGVDIDPVAIASAHQNAVLNNVEPEKMQLHLLPSEAGSHSLDERTHGNGEKQVPCSKGVIYETEKYDVVIANILLNPLLDLADHIVSYAKFGAVVGVSGILSEQLPYIIERYSQLLDDISVSHMDDWACISGTKKQSFSST